MLARLHVGNTLGGQRVAAQVGEGAVVVDARGVLQLLEHAHKTLAGVPGLRHDAVPHTVGLTLHVARKIELVLRRHGLPAHHQRVGRVGAFAGGQCAQDHCANQPRRLAALLRHQPRDMALGDVAHFMGQHRREFVPAADHTNQAQVHTHVTTGQRKRVDAAVLAQQDLPRKPLLQLGRQLAARAGSGHQGLPDVLHIFDQHRVVDVVRVAVQLAGNTVTQTALGRRRHVAAVAQRGQLRQGRNGLAHQQRSQHGRGKRRANQKAQRGKWHGKFRRSARMMTQTRKRSVNSPGLPQNMPDRAVVPHDSPSATSFFA